MTTEEAGEALASLATSLMPRPLLEIWRSQRPTFRVAPLPTTVTKPQVDPPFWKMVADAWADDFIFKAYLRQEKKRALLASLLAALLTQTPPSSSTVATTKTTISNVGDATISLPTATAAPLCSPPRIDVDEEEDYKEAVVPIAKTSDKENRLVEVCVSRGMGGEADERRGVQAHRHRMYTPGTPQHATRRSLSPTPDGFVRNHGQNYVPLRIPTTNGRGVATAKWVKVRMGVNPVVWGCMYRGGVVYQGDVHATPDHDHGPTPDYTNEQLLRLHSDYCLCHEVDEALVQIGDQSLVTEVTRYRNTMDGIQQIQKEICEKEDELYCLSNTNCKSVGRLAEAHALVCIAEEEMISNGLMIITLWVMECRCSG
jgi:hypothetical protein